MNNLSQFPYQIMAGISGFSVGVQILRSTPSWPIFIPIALGFIPQTWLVNNLIKVLFDEMGWQAESRGRKWIEVTFTVIISLSLSILMTALNAMLVSHTLPSKQRMLFVANHVATLFKVVGAFYGCLGGPLLIGLGLNNLCKAVTGQDLVYHSRENFEVVYNNLRLR